MIKQKSCTLTEKQAIPPSPPVCENPALDRRRAVRQEYMEVATPKGMQSQQFPVNASDAIHLYSDDNHIWLQIRRKVPTEQDIGRSSFKVACAYSPAPRKSWALS
jgi:hypothetical protein